VLSTAHQVVFISPVVRKEFEGFCRFRAPPVYLPNGVDTKIYTSDGPVADDPAIVNARRSGKRVLLFVGRFVEKKGLSILRELVAAFPDDLWIFAGQGPLDPTHWALPNVHVVHGEMGAGLARYYRTADLLVLPSVGEGFPLVVQESMACGTPVMVGEDTAAGCPDARHLMLVEKVGDSDTAVRWAWRLSELRESSHRLLALRPEVAKFAHKRWSWESTSAEYAKLLDSIELRKSSS
jgi:glycosyltransferase involved in cell wall biosynthesis